MRTSGMWGRLFGFWSRPVALSSPYPPEECLRRLATVTTRRGSSWYLSSKNVGRPEPRFRGDVVSTSRILVARWKDVSGRRGFAPWLHARLEPAADGGAALTGTIGLHPGTRVAISTFVIVAGLIAATTFAEGTGLVVSGHPGGLAAAVLAPLAWAAIVAGFRTACMRRPERTAGQLLRDMSEAVGSTSSAGFAADGRSA